MEKQYPSRLLEKAVSEFSRLPGIGRKTSLRLVLHMLRQTNEDVDGFVSAISHLKKEVKYCKVCHNISDTLFAYHDVLSVQTASDGTVVHYLHASCRSQWWWRHGDSLQFAKEITWTWWLVISAHLPYHGVAILMVVPK